MAERDHPHGEGASTALAEPAWDIARIFPGQGFWSEQEYLDLPTNHLVEFSDGQIEVLPMPSPAHQRIVRYLFRLFSAFVDTRALGEVLFAPLPVRLRAGQFREPDLVFLAAAHRDKDRAKYWAGADLVVEVVSNDNRAHDLETKREEYARAGIPEYWIVDPLNGEITVLTLAGDTYREHGRFGAGSEATSVLLPGLAVPVAGVFAAAEGE
ncbi:MAG: Uma2 family endonuclease [Armatimonadetes bacterium]|nr:Uma2 family endonuclease [Armatimonadota bacterium]